jgi:hypothetical protein
MNNLFFRRNGRLGRPVTILHRSPCLWHPTLSASELECLAQRISSFDGVSLAQARQQIAQFRGTPSGPRVEAMRRRIRGLPLALAVSLPLH